MAKSTLTIDFELVWQKGDEVRPCTCCEDLIVSGSNHGYMRVVGKKELFDIKLTVCNSCLDLIKDK